MFSSRASMRQFVFRNEDNENEPSLNEEETIDYCLSDVELAFTSTKIIGLGKLYVTSTRVIWIGEQKAYEFDVPFIILHAITHDSESYPKACLYCQLDSEEEYNDSNDEENEENEDSDNNERDDKLPTELFFAPTDEVDLIHMFDAFSRAALLNPDEAENDEMDGELIYNLDEVQLGAEQSKALDHLESVFQFPKEDHE